MRFAITACDLYEDIFTALLEEGWEPVKLFTWPVPFESYVLSNRSVIARADSLGIPIQLSRMTERDMQDLAEQGCDVLVGAGYQWRIGDWRPYLTYAINFHPSPLPKARGPYPTPQAIMERHSQWGVTCHKFAKDFDTGDIVDQEMFPLAPADCHYSTSIKIQMAGKRLAIRVAQNLPELWNNAPPQVGGSYWKRSTHEDMLMDFSKTVEEVLLHAAAFGPIEVLAVMEEVTLHVRRVVGWVEAHSHQPGKLVHRNNRNLVVAVADGYVGLVEWSCVDRRSFEECGRW